MAKTNKQQASKEEIFNRIIRDINVINRTYGAASFKTKANYTELIKPYIKFLVEDYGIKALKNSSSKHFSAYMEKRKADGVSASTLKTTASAIRFYHSKSNSKYALITNTELGLKRREFGKENKAFTMAEIKELLILAGQSDRLDIFLAVCGGYLLGMRLEEICTATVEKVNTAKRDGELEIKGKNGLVRATPISSDERSRFINLLSEYAKEYNLTSKDKILPGIAGKSVKAMKKSVQNFLNDYKELYTVKNRSETLPTEGSKKRSETLSFHGLRHFYVQTRLKEYEEEGIRDISQRRAKISSEIGHSREEIVKTYEG